MSTALNPWASLPRGVYRALTPEERIAIVKERTAPYQLSGWAEQLLSNLAAYQPDPVEQEVPERRLAGVLVLLRANEEGEIEVVLTTRSQKLRSHPGETALPGGRYDKEDGWVERTALREANEEIGLKIDEPSSLLYLTTLPAFTSRTLLVVIPTVYFLLSRESTPKFLQSLKPNPAEVEHIFLARLDMFAGFGERENQERDKELKWERYDFEWLNDSPYLLHYFTHPTFPSGVSGLTADIILTAGLIAVHGLSAAQEIEERGSGPRMMNPRWADGQLPWAEIVRLALEEGKDGKHKPAERKLRNGKGVTEKAPQLASTGP